MGSSKVFLSSFHLHRRDRTAVILNQKTELFFLFYHRDPYPAGSAGFLHAVTDRILDDRLQKQRRNHLLLEALLLIDLIKKLFLKPHLIQQQIGLCKLHLLLQRYVIVGHIGENLEIIPQIQAELRHFL